MPISRPHKSPLSKYKLNFALRLNKQATGTRLISGQTNEQHGISNDITGIDQETIGTDKTKGGGSFDVRSAALPFADNDDIYKVRFKKRGMTRFKRRLVKLRRWYRVFLVYLGELLSPKYSPDEKFYMVLYMQRWKADDLEDHRRRKDEERIFRLHREQARLVGNQIIDVLTNLRFSHHIQKDDRIYVKGRIKFSSVDVSPYAYTYHIVRTPPNVKKTDMAQDWVATEIASTIGKKIRHDLDLNGLRYTVEVGSTLSIPNFTSYEEFERMPSTMPPLAFYIGQTINGTNVYRNLADAPHMIVAGQTGGGKSNLLNGIICGYIKRNSNAIVKLILFDLKGGVEFDSFYGTPHLWRFADDHDGIVEYPESVIPALKAVLDECNRRLSLLKKARNKNIAEYNRGKHPKNRLPYLVGVFDEYTTARKLAGGDVETLLSTIANLSRAAGIHFILGTQYPKAEILSTLISVNFPWRVAFAMTTAASSSVLGNWNAAGLTPVGRAILQTSEGELMIQTPRITESTIHQIIDDAKAGTANATANTVDDKEIIEWCLNNTGTRMDETSVWNQFKERITIRELRNLLKSMENQIYDIGGNLYRVLPGSNLSPRRLESVDGSQTQAEMSRVVRRAEEIEQNAEKEA